MSTVECISMHNLNEYEKIIEKIPYDKQLVVYGAGTMGAQFGQFLEKKGMHEFLFCDGNPQKCNTTLIGHNIISVEELERRKGRCVVYITIEKFSQPLKSLQEKGFQFNRDLFVIRNYSEEVFIHSVKNISTQEQLILGDCTLTSVSIYEDSPKSIADYINNDARAIVSLNGLYMRQYYSVLKQAIKECGSLKQVYLVTALDIFCNKYHVLPGNQHVRVFKQLWDESEYDEDLINILKSREDVAYSSLFSSNSMEYDDAKKRKMQFVNLNLYYMAEIDKNNESVEYLRKSCRLCKDNGIGFSFVLLPFNCELASEVSKGKFGEVYKNNKRVLAEALKEHTGSFVDYSEVLDSDEFMTGLNVMEGIRNNGRQMIARLLEKDLWAGH